MVQKKYVYMRSYRKDLLKDTLDVIREEYEEIFDKDDGVNQFTVTGIQKFAIVQMILAGMNQAVIKEFTGQGDDILEDCQRQVNVEKKIDITDISTLQCAVLKHTISYKRLNNGCLGYDYHLEDKSLTVNEYESECIAALLFN